MNLNQDQTRGIWIYNGSICIPRGALGVAMGRVDGAVRAWGPHGDVRKKIYAPVVLMCKLTCPKERMEGIHYFIW